MAKLSKVHRLLPYMQVAIRFNYNCLGDFARGHKWLASAIVALRPRFSFFYSLLPTPYSLLNPKFCEHFLRATLPIRDHLVSQVRKVLDSHLA